MVTKILSPLLSSGEATVSSRTIFQEGVSVDAYKGPMNGRTRPQKEIPKYGTALEYTFTSNGKIITTYDAEFLYDGYYPRAMIEHMTSRFGPGPVNIQLVDNRLDKHGIPWFINGTEFDRKSYADTGFLELINAGSFLNKEKTVSIHYLKFAPHFNDLESFRPGIVLFFGRFERFAAVIMAAALLSQLWNMAYKDYFEASRFTGYFVWLLVLFFIFIFFPARPLPTKQIQFPPQQTHQRPQP